MNPNDMKLVREAIFALGFDGGGGAGGVLNQAMFAGKPESLIGDPSIINLVADMIKKVPSVQNGSWYLSSLTMLQNYIGAPAKPSGGGTPPAATTPPDLSGLMALLASLGFFVKNGWITLRVASGFTCDVGVSENDSGLRIAYNFDQENGWVNPKTGKKTSYSNPKMMQVFVFIEQDGRVSVNYVHPLLDKDGSEINAGEWDDSPERRKAGDLSRAGKDILLIPQGYGTNGLKGPSVLVASGVPGRTIELGAVPVGGTPNWPKAGLRVGAGEAFAVDGDGTTRKL